MGLVSFDRANVRFQVFQEIMARQRECDPARAMAEAVTLADQLWKDISRPSSTGRKDRSNKPRRAALG